jgi:GTP cyclohydrolase I
MEERRFLVDAELRDLPFPVRVISRSSPEGQLTVANISILARISGMFQARWIDRFIQEAHRHRNRMGTETLREDIRDYLDALQATMARLKFEYPFFMEQETPVSKEKCLVRYACVYSVEVISADKEPQITFEIQVPVVTTYPGSSPEQPGGLFGQSSIVTIATRSRENVFPEDLIEIANQHALSPVYSFLTEEDQAYVIQQIHSQVKTSLVMTDEIQAELSHRHDIDWFSVRSSNYGILHPYSTAIGTEKSRWLTLAAFDEEL